MKTDPVSAGLAFALSKRRREEGGFPGHERIARILAEGPTRKRVGLSLEGRLPAREDAPVFLEAKQVGHVTSGGFSPTLGHPIAMAYLDAKHCAPGTAVEIGIRERRVAATIVPMPFVPHRYHRKGAA
jgi:aminomethyltransferase